MQRMSGENLNPSEYQKQIAFNTFHGINNNLSLLFNKDEVKEIIESFNFYGEMVSIPFPFFVEKHYESNSLISFTENEELLFTIEAHKTEEIDLDEYCLGVFGTLSKDHPGVEFIRNNSNIILSGKVVYLNDNMFAHIPHSSIPFAYNSTVFQSRNPPHKAHESIITKYSPNLLYTTPYSTTNKNDYSFDVKIEALEKIKEIYGVDLFVSTLPRLFAGPREALQNCLLFQKIGASKMIMGRGKNCIKDFYGHAESYDFCRSFYDKGMITIEPIWQEDIYSNGVELKASTIKKEFIDSGIVPPENFMSSYISDILLKEKEC